MPTEQTSISILNMFKLINSPYGQVITTLWRGKESRMMVKKHVGVHYKVLEDMVRGGVSVKIDEALVSFNVVCFFVAGRDYYSNFKLCNNDLSVTSYL